MWLHTAFHSVLNKLPISVISLNLRRLSIGYFQITCDEWKKINKKVEFSTFVRVCKVRLLGAFLQHPPPL